MKSLAFLIVKKNRTDEVKNKIGLTSIFNSFATHSELGVVYLLNSGIDTRILKIPEDDYFYVELDNYNTLGFSGAWTGGLAGDLCCVYGSMTFIIAEMSDSEHYLRLKNLYGGLLLKHNLAAAASFMNRGHDFVHSFVDSVAKDGPANEDDLIYWNLLQELSSNSGDDFNTIIQTLVISYTFHQLGISVDSDDDKKTLICSLDGMVPLQRFIFFKDVLEEEMSELEEGDTYQFAYSIWTGSHNSKLFKSMDLDNGDYLSYPTLKVGVFSGEPETGAWY